MENVKKSKKPRKVMLQNTIIGAVDTVKQLCHCYTVERKPKR